MPLCPNQSRADIAYANYPRQLFAMFRAVKPKLEAKYLSKPAELPIEKSAVALIRIIEDIYIADLLHQDMPAVQLPIQ